MIKAYLFRKQENWDLNLGRPAAAYRACPHESIGLSPNLQMLGRELHIPSELLFAGQCNNDKAIVSYGDFIANLKEIIQHAHDIARKRLGSNARRQLRYMKQNMLLTNTEKGM